MPSSEVHKHQAHTLCTCLHICRPNMHAHIQQIKLSKYNLRLLNSSVMVYKIHLSPIHHNKIREVNISMFEMYIFICRPDLTVKTTVNQLENLHAMEKLDSRLAASKWKQPTKGKVRITHDNGRQDQRMNLHHLTYTTLCH